MTRLSPDTLWEYRNEDNSSSETGHFACDQEEDIAYADDKAVQSSNDFLELRDLAPAEMVLVRARDGEDAAAEPLLARPAYTYSSTLGSGSSVASSHDGDQLDPHGRLQFGWFIYLLTLCAGISGLLFGYDTGVISSTLVSIGGDLTPHQLGLNTVQKSLITSATSFFALLASPVAGILSDRLGRKTCIMLADALFVGGAIMQGLASNVPVMVAGRSIIGLAVGAASFVAPLYVAELAPASVRGSLVTVISLFITGGQVVAYVIGWAFSHLPSGWRWMVGIGALPALLQLGLLISMPETPRWLVMRGHSGRARAVLSDIYGADRTDIVQGVLQGVESEVAEERAARKSSSGAEPGLGETLAELLKDGGNRRALTISCLLQGSQQLCGFNSLMYFSATIFAMLGFCNPIATSLTVAGTNFVFTLITFASIDRIGRRNILLYSMPFMVLGLALCALSFHFILLPPPGGPTPLPTCPSSSASPTTPWPSFILSSLLLYVAAYALGLGCVPWQQSELFPLPVRSLGSGIATATNWAANTIVGFTFLPLLSLLTPTGTFSLYAVVCGASWVAVYCIYPETAGLGLEEVRVLLVGGWGVQESVRRFREGKRERRGG